ncbi:MAG TPA: hypothetical protein VK894_10480, partial [Jiangellales bacterium]|nr:hypothetical protein [Jiangellales bacterium]
EELLALHRATADRHPGLAQLLAPWTEHHRQHLAALGTGGPAPAAPQETTNGGTPVAGTGTPAPTSSTPATAADSPTPAVPDEPAAALAAVRTAEAAAAEARLLDCLASTDRDLAALLASSGAAEAAHAALLAGR